jgi:hypothetical protein
VWALPLSAAEHSSNPGGIVRVAGVVVVRVPVVVRIRRIGRRNNLQNLTFSFILF